MPSCAAAATASRRITRCDNPLKRTNKADKHTLKQENGQGGGRRNAWGLPGVNNNELRQRGKVLEDLGLRGDPGSRMEAWEKIEITQAAVSESAQTKKSVNWNGRKGIQGRVTRNSKRHWCCAGSFR